MWTTVDKRGDFIGANRRTVSAVLRDADFQSGTINGLANGLLAGRA